MGRRMKGFVLKLCTVFSKLDLCCNPIRIAKFSKDDLFTVKD